MIRVLNCGMNSYNQEQIRTFDDADAQFITDKSTVMITADFSGYYCHVDLSIFNGMNTSVYFNG